MAREWNEIAEIRPAAARPFKDERKTIVSTQNKYRKKIINRAKEIGSHEQRRNQNRQKKKSINVYLMGIIYFI